MRTFLRLPKDTTEAVELFIGLQLMILLVAIYIQGTLTVEAVGVMAGIFTLGAIFLSIGLQAKHSKEAAFEDRMFRLFAAISEVREKLWYVHTGNHEPHPMRPVPTHTPGTAFRIDRPKSDSGSEAMSVFIGSCVMNSDVMLQNKPKDEIGADFVREMQKSGAGGIPRFVGLCESALLLIEQAPSKELRHRYTKLLGELLTSEELIVLHFAGLASRYNDLGRLLPKARWFQLIYDHLGLREHLVRLYRQQRKKRKR